jgi:hypothetical protein
MASPPVPVAHGAVKLTESMELPKADTIRLRAAAGVWHRFAEQVEEIRRGGDAASDRFAAANRSDAVENICGIWGHFSSDATGPTASCAVGGQDAALDAVVRVARKIAADCEGFAKAIDTAKAQIQALDIAGVALLIAGGVGMIFSFGTSEVVAASLAATTRAAIAEILIAVVVARLRQIIASVALGAAEGLVFNAVFNSLKLAALGQAKQAASSNYRPDPGQLATRAVSHDAIPAILLGGAVRGLGALRGGAVELGGVPDGGARPTSGKLRIKDLSPSLRDLTPEEAATVYGSGPPLLDPASGKFLDPHTRQPVYPDHPRTLFPQTEPDPSPLPDLSSVGQPHAPAAESPGAKDWYRRRPTVLTTEGSAPFVVKVEQPPLTWGQKVTIGTTGALAVGGAAGAVSNLYTMPNWPRSLDQNQLATNQDAGGTLDAVLKATNSRDYYYTPPNLPPTARGELHYADWITEQRRAGVPDSEILARARRSSQWQTLMGRIGQEQK